MASPMGWRRRLGLRIDPASVRGEVEHVNVGILAISGFSQGLYGGENIANLWQPIILMASFAGALSVGPAWRFCSVRRCRF